MLNSLRLFRSWLANELARIEPQPLHELAFDIFILLPLMCLAAVLGAICGILLGIYDILFHPRKIAVLVISLGLLALSGCASPLPSKADFYPRTLEPSTVHVVGTYGDALVIRINATLSGVGMTCTGSMHPFFGCQNTAILEKLHPETTVNVGDIVRYEKNGKAYFHQVVAISGPGNLTLLDRYFLFGSFQKIEGTCYIVKGFNVAKPDPWCVRRDQITHRAIGVLFTNTTEVDWE